MLDPFEKLMLKNLNRTREMRAASTSSDGFNHALNSALLGSQVKLHCSIAPTQKVLDITKPRETVRVGLCH